ncbi:MAG: 2-phospho-L-lactate guanylyltransferase [Anaerolineae bacterium]
MNVWAIVPVKPFNRAKSRLAPVLSGEQRELLAERMFRHGLTVLTAIDKIAGVLVISRDTKALSIARDYGAHTVQESGTPELNPALARATEIIRLRDAEGALILPADLPLYTSDDIAQLLHLGRYQQSVVIAPDRADNGTNALLLVPPTIIPPSFGPGSFHRHYQLAEAASARIEVYRSARLAVDIDTPDDLTFYQHILGEPLFQGL